MYKKKLRFVVITNIIIMSLDKYAIIVAAGSGRRMSSNIPKQFLDLDAVPILIRTIVKFKEAIPDLNLVIVMNQEYMQMWKDLLEKHNIQIRQRLVSGGLTRFHSVQNALQVVPDDAIVAVHDGVRPLVSKRLIRDMFSRVEEENLQNLIPVLHIVDTLKMLEYKGDDNYSLLSEEVDRNKLFAVQTPQVFMSQSLKKAYKSPYIESFTDDSSVLSYIGEKINYCTGERTNIKITRQEDLSLASILLRGGLKDE